MNLLNSYLGLRLERLLLISAYASNDYSQSEFTKLSQGYSKGIARLYAIVVFGSEMLLLNVKQATNVPPLYPLL